MKKIYQSFALIAALCLLNACMDSFENINTRQDRLTKIDPEHLFGLTPVETLRELSSNNNWYFFGNYSNQLSVIGGGGPHFVKDGRSERIWSNLYINALNPLFQIVNNYDGDPAYTNRVAIAKIWRSYVLSQLVALYGPLPYTDACNNEPYTKYDSEETIYYGILNELKEAYDALNEKGDKYPEKADPFLKSDIKRWSQFARCIRLRVAIRLANILPDADAAARYGLTSVALRNDMIPAVRALQDSARAIVSFELDNAEKGLLIKSNSENFKMEFSMAPVSNNNPLFTQVRNATLSEKTGGAGNLPVIHESLIMWMRPYKDPCWNKYILEGEGREINRYTQLDPVMGRPHSMGSPPNFGNLQISSPFGNYTLYEDYCRIGNLFTNIIAEFPFFTYSELCFTRAEATLLGFWENPSKTAEYYYNEGIDARCARVEVGGSAVSEYKNFAGIKWGVPSDTVPNESTKVNRDHFRDWQYLIDSYLGGDEDNYKRIIVQHWLSLFIQGWDAYTLLRRTGIMKFKPHFEASSSEGYLDTKDGFTWAYTPQRLCYPNTEININRKETRYAIDHLFTNIKPHDPVLTDQLTYRLIFTKDAPTIQTEVVGNNGNSIYYDLPNLARNY